MTHQSLPPMHSSSHSLNHVFYLGVFAAVGACARPARVLCAGRPGTDCCPPELLVKRGGLARGACPRGCRHQLRFHSRNVCQRPLQDHAGAAVCPPLHCIHRERGHKMSIAHLVPAAFAHLLPLRALRAFLELIVDRAAKNSPRQTGPSPRPPLPKYRGCETGHRFRCLLLVAVCTMHHQQVYDSLMKHSHWIYILVS